MNKAGFLLIFIVLSSPVQADAFRCKGEKGQTMISSLPCTDHYATTRVINSDNSNPDSVRRAQAEAERKKQWLNSREPTPAPTGSQYQAAPAARPRSPQ